MDCNSFFIFLVSIDKKFPRDIIINHNDKSTNYEIDRIGKKKDLFLGKKIIVEESLYQHTNNHTDNRKEYKEYDSFETFRKSGFTCFIYHISRHKVIDKNADYESAGSRHDCNIRGSIVLKSNELHYIARQKVKDCRNKAYNCKAKNFPKKIIGLTFSLKIEFINQNFVCVS